MKTSQRQTGKHKMRRIGLPLLALLLLASMIGLFTWQGKREVAQAASPVAFPSDAGLIDVKASYGAVGDGVADDTAAIQQAIAENVGMHRTLYFPEGTYLVRNGFDWKNTAGQWRSYLTIQGAGMDSTTIKLADSTSGFGDANAAKAVLRPGSKTDDPACSNYGQDAGDGGGNCGFGNYLFDLTIDTGAGNPGAIGVDFIASNYGGMEYVRVRSGDGAGVAGIALTREVGPALLKHIEVNGFNIGINADRDLYSITLEDITLQNQGSIGLRNAYNTLAVRGLTSTNTVPAVVNDADLGLVALTDATLNGGDAANSAIVNRGTFLARNVSTTGYRSAIQQGDTVVDGTEVTEWVSHAVEETFPSPDQTLRLPVRETPEFHSNDMGTWVNVASYGAVPNDGVDDTAAIQAAIDSGKSTVYMVPGDYTVSATIILRGNVQRVLGFMAHVGGSASPIWKTGDLTTGTVILDRFRTGAIEHVSSGTLVVRHLQGSVLTTQNGAGAVFLDDVIVDLVLNGGQLWARQLNAEGSLTTGVTNSGAEVWILGMKSEGTMTTIRTQNGGKTELLGGLMYALGGDGSAAYINDESSVSLTFTEISYQDFLNFENFVEEKRGGETRYLTHESGAWRGHGRMVPLYTGYTGGTTNLALNKPATSSSVESAALDAGNAVDGNSATRWSSAFSDPQWIQLDLGAAYSINLIKLYWEVAYGKAYQIQVSDDAQNWTTIYSTSNGGGENLLVQGNGRYLRLYGTERGTPWGYSLWEFEAYSA